MWVTARPVAAGDLALARSSALLTAETGVESCLLCAKATGDGLTARGEDDICLWWAERNWAMALGGGGGVGLVAAETAATAAAAALGAVVEMTLPVAFCRRAAETAAADWLLWSILIMAVCSAIVVSRVLMAFSSSATFRYMCVSMEEEEKIEREEKKRGKAAVAQRRIFVLDFPFLGMEM